LTYLQQTFNIHKIQVKTMSLIKKGKLQLFIVFLTLLSFDLPAAATNVDFTIQNDLGGSLETGSNGSDSNISLNRNYWGDYISDSGALFGAPFHWCKSDWKTVGGVLLITAALYKNDTQIMKWVRDNRTSASNSIASFARAFGDERVLLPLAVLYVYGCQTDEDRARKTALLSLESLAQSGILINCIKFAGNRSRPYSGDSFDTWGGPSFNTDDSKRSFPSGHTATAFSVATIVADEYRDHPAIPVISYSIATLTGLSRIHDNAHWASDVFFGAAIGYFTSKTLLARHPDNEKTWTVLPKTDGTNVGLAVAYHF
jgi:membrane-associated phospholipid phosphatase